MRLQQLCDVRHVLLRRQPATSLRSSRLETALSGSRCSAGPMSTRKSAPDCASFRFTDCHGSRPPSTGSAAPAGVIQARHMPALVHRTPRRRIRPAPFAAESPAQHHDRIHVRHRLHLEVRVLAFSEARSESEVTCIDQAQSQMSASSIITQPERQRLNSCNTSSIRPTANVAPRGGGKPAGETSLTSSYIDQHCAPGRPAISPHSQCPATLQKSQTQHPATCAIRRPAGNAAPRDSDRGWFRR